MISYLDYKFEYYETNSINFLVNFVAYLTQGQTLGKAVGDKPVNSLLAYGAQDKILRIEICNILKLSN